jgi:hypothetical protein
MNAATSIIMTQYLIFVIDQKEIFFTTEFGNFQLLYISGEPAVAEAFLLISNWFLRINHTFEINRSEANKKTNFSDNREAGEVVVTFLIGHRHTIHSK